VSNLRANAGIEKVITPWNYSFTQGGTVTNNVITNAYPNGLDSPAVDKSDAIIERNQLAIDHRNHLHIGFDF